VIATVPVHVEHKTPEEFSTSTLGGVVIAAPDTPAATVLMKTSE
jgi:hypothetical protein